MFDDTRDDTEEIPAFLAPLLRVTLPSPELPRFCAQCQIKLSFGWLDEDFHDPISLVEPFTIRVARIPRPDQTMFCPNCESRILN